MKINLSISDVLSFFEENDVKFVRLAFVDIFGREKNMAVMASNFENVVKNGVSIDASSVDGFESVVNSELLLFPVISTMTVLPWRPTQGSVVRFYCDVMTTEGQPYEVYSRLILKRAVEKISKLGLVAKVGFESEFYLTKTNDCGDPIKEPVDKAGYLDIAPLDKCNNLRRECCLCLEDMGIKPLNSHHEQGHGQNEIDFMFGEALEVADNFVTFKALVKAIAARNGYFASFMPKPFADMSGSGLHLNISLWKEDDNLFQTKDGEICKVKRQFISGILRFAKECSAVSNPISNSFERLGKMEAPKVVGWSMKNRSQLVRIPTATKLHSRIELRSPDSACNPYLTLALALSAGAFGIENELELEEQSDFDAYQVTADEQKLLPKNLESATDIFENSEFCKNTLGEKCFENYLAMQKKLLSENLTNEYYFEIL